MVPLTGVRMARRPMYFTAQKAVRELGLPQSPVDQAMRQAVQWFYEHGYCISQLAPVLRTANRPRHTGGDN
jgi:hypothetical protein